MVLMAGLALQGQNGERLVATGLCLLVWHTGSLLVSPYTSHSNAATTLRYSHTEEREVAPAWCVRCGSKYASGDGGADFKPITNREAPTAR